MPPICRNAFNTRRWHQLEKNQKYIKINTNNQVFLCLAKSVQKKKYGK